MINIPYLAVSLWFVNVIIVASYGNKSDLGTSFAIVFVAVLGDNLLKTCESDYLRGAVDSCTHGLIGLFSWYIVTLHRGYNFDKFEILLGGILASGIDLDHFLMARSIHLRDALHLSGGRPFLHNSTIPVIILVINIFIMCSFGIRSARMLRLGWVLWTAFTSHHVRDANRRGLWFNPIGSTPPLSSSYYILITLILPYFTVFMMNKDIYKYFAYRSNIIVSMTEETFSMTYEKEIGEDPKIHIV